MGMVGGPRRAIAVAVTTCALVGTGVASAEEERGIDPNQGESLVEVTLPSKGAAMRLQLEDERYGVEFNDHYLRRNGDGTVTVTVFGTEADLAALEDAGYAIGATIEGPAIWRERAADRQSAARKETRAESAAEGDTVGTLSHQDEVVILRADYFENRDGRFLSVEAKTRAGSAAPTGSTYVGPDLALSWNTGSGTPISTAPRVMSTNIDPDTTPDTYIEHRELVRIGEPGTSSPARPTRIRVGSSTGEFKEGDVSTWLGGGLPPMASNFVKDFTTKYLDPTELYGEFEKLAAEYPNISELITLPNKTNGYQRRAQATMAGCRPAGQHAAHRGAERRGRADLAGVGPRGRQRDHGRVPQPGRRRELPARGHGERQGRHGPARDECRRLAVEHRRPGRRRDQRPPGASGSWSRTGSPA